MKLVTKSVLFFLLIQPLILDAQKLTDQQGVNDNKCALLKGDTLWVGTELGLVGWDLKTETIFANFHKGNSSIFENYIHEICMDSKGLLWVLGKYSVSWWDGKTWRNKQFLERGVYSSGYTEVSKIALGKQGEVAIGTYDGLFVYKENKWNCLYEHNSDLRGNVFAVDNENVLWYEAAEGSGLVRFDLNNVTDISQTPNSNSSFIIYEPQGWFYYIFVDSKNRKWLSDNKNWYFENDSSWKKIACTYESYHHPLFIKEDKKQRIWFDSQIDVGVVDKDSIEFIKLTGKIGALLNQYVKNVLPEDIVIADNGIWVITDLGLYHFDTNQYYPFIDFNFSYKLVYVGNSGFINNKLIIVTSQFLLAFENGQFRKIPK